MAYDLEAVLKDMVDRQATNAHIKVRTPVYFRILDQLERTEHPVPGMQDLEGFALFAAIQERGTRKVFRMRQTVEITSLTDREAKTLGVAAGKPVLAVHRLLIGAEDQPLAYSRIVEIGERFKLETEFERIR